MSRSVLALTFLIATVLFFNSSYAADLVFDGVSGDGQADLIVDVSNGNAWIDTDGLIFTGFILRSRGDHFNFPLATTTDQNDWGLPLSTFVVSTAGEASSPGFFNPFFFPNSQIQGFIRLGPSTTHCLAA